MADNEKLVKSEPTRTSSPWAFLLLHPEFEPPPPSSSSYPFSSVSRRCIFSKRRKDEIKDRASYRHRIPIILPELRLDFAGASMLVE